jgi:hypothetical protein
VANTSTPEPTQTTSQPTLEPGVLVVAHVSTVAETSAPTAEVSATQTTIYAPTVEPSSVTTMIIPVTGQTASSVVTVERFGEWLSGLVAASVFFWFAALLYRHLR